MEEFFSSIRGMARHGVILLLGNNRQDGTIIISATLRFLDPNLASSSFFCPCWFFCPCQ